MPSSSRSRAEGLLALAVVIVVTPLLAGPVRLRAVAVILAIVALGIGYFALIAPLQAIQHVKVLGRERHRP